MRFAILLYIIAASALSAPVVFASPSSSSGGTMQKGPNAREAIAAEYARLKARGTREALELFIERHPGDPLAEEAKEEIERRYGKK
jgi:hypothetical protein